MSEPADATDPLAEIVTHLQPSARFSKVVGAVAPWRIRRPKDGQPFYLLMLKGSCDLALAGQTGVTPLTGGDFVLIPAAQNATISSRDPAPPDDMDSQPVILSGGGSGDEFRLGATDVPPQAQWLVGHFEFGAPDATLLVSLLPQFVLVQGQSRLTTLVQLVIDESRANRPARALILSRLLEVLLIEAFRSASPTAVSAGLMRGLADDRLATAIRAIHHDPRRAWTIADLAGLAALSRSAFFARFSGAVGVAPMEYLLAWRMAQAKSQLMRGRSVASVAGQVGYGSASAFSVAFARHVGQSPSAYALLGSAPAA